MDIKLNVAAIFRGENINREKIIVFDIEVNDVLCYKKSYLPSKSASIGNESKAELHAIHQALLKCNEEFVSDANIIIYYLKRNIFANLYKDGVKDLSSLQSTQIINMFSKIQSNIEALILRGCKVSFIEREDYKPDLINFADEELKKDVLTEPFDIINECLKISNFNQIECDDSSSFYSESIKNYKEQISNLDILHNIPELDEKSENYISKSPEYLAILSEELTSIKNQCNLYDSEIAKIQKEIEDIILLKNNAHKKCEILAKEIEQLDKELSQNIAFIENNIDSITKTEQSINLNKQYILEKNKELKNLDTKIENIVNDNSNMINYLKNEIEAAIIKKYFLTNIKER